MNVLRNNINFAINVAALGLVGLTLSFHRALEIPGIPPQAIALSNEGGATNSPAQQNEKTATVAGFRVGDTDSPSNTRLDDVTSSLPKTLTFNLTLSKLADLRIHQGDTISAGQIIADRADEWQRLNSERHALALSLEKIRGSTIPTPMPPANLPTLSEMPPVSYAEEQTAIANTALAVQQAQRQLQLQQSKLKDKPLEESANLSKAQANLNEKNRLLDNQQRKIDMVQQVNDLPPDVLIHEQEVLKERESDRVQALAELQQAQAKLATASSEQMDRQQHLAEALEKAQSEHQLAVSKLQTAKDKRAYQEYEHSIVLSKQAEERNTLMQNHQRQVSEWEQRQRERSFQAAQIQAKIAETDNQLSALSTVRSPYAGRIQRIRFNQQNDKSLSVDVVLIINRDQAVASEPSLRPGVTTGTGINPPVRPAR